MVQATFELRARQQMSLTPRLQQSVKLLQMSALEFTQEVQQALATNPFLDEDMDEGDTRDADDALREQEGADFTALSGALLPGEGPSSATGDDVQSMDSPALDEGASLMDAGSDTDGSESDYPSDYPGEYSGDYPLNRAGGSDGDDGSDIGIWARASQDLGEHLRHELCSYRLEDRDRLLVELVVEALDEDGYLRQEFDELASAMALSPAPTQSEWMTALRLVQQLDAPGIAARDLRECLLLQLDALDASFPGRDTARRIVDGYLDKLARHDYTDLGRQLQLPEEDIRAACRLIRKLDPKPGLRYARPDTAYVVPDVIVRKVKGRWVVATNRGALPRARLHRTYADMFRQTRGGDRAPMAQELQEARWLIRNMEQRFSTIQRVAEAIVERQQTFFEYGEIALRPLMLREIADELGLHESTVSRATGNKYMDTPSGIFEFRHFFSRELTTDTGGSCSAAAVRALIKEMIAAESPEDPLSDVALARKLAEQGVVVARRTVTKYRGLMKVPPAELRRDFVSEEAGTAIA